MRMLIAALSICGAIQPAFGADSYLCIPDKSAGFSYSTATKTWDYARFDVRDSKYLLKRSDSKWSWSIFGKNPFLSMTVCTSQSPDTFIFCNGFYDVRVNTKSLRFQLVYPIGYTNSYASPSDEGGDTPYLEIGKCSPL